MMVLPLKDTTIVVGGSVCGSCGQLRKWEDLRGLPPVCVKCERESPEPATVDILRERGLW